jgi:hypothetical protein
MEALMEERQMENWNDDRLGELSGRVDDGFAKVDERFVRLEREMKEGFARVDQRFERVDRHFERVDQRFERVDQRFEGVDKRFDGVATKEEMGEVKADLRRLNDKFDRLLHALTVAGLSFGITLFATMAGLVVTQV